MIWAAVDESGWNSESRQAMLGAQVRVEIGERVRRGSWGHGLEVGLTGSREEVTHPLFFLAPPPELAFTGNRVHCIHSRRPRSPSLARPLGLSPSKPTLLGPSPGRAPERSPGKDARHATSLAPRSRRHWEEKLRLAVTPPPAFAYKVQM